MTFGSIHFQWLRLNLTGVISAMQLMHTWDLFLAIISTLIQGSKNSLRTCVKKVVPYNLAPLLFLCTIVLSSGLPDLSENADYKCWSSNEATFKIHYKIIIKVIYL